MPRITVSIDGRSCGAHEQVHVAHGPLAGAIDAERAESGAFEGDTADPRTSSRIVEASQQLVDARFTQHGVLALLRQERLPRRRPPPAQVVREQHGDPLHRSGRSRHGPLELAPLRRRVGRLHQLPSEMLRGLAQRRGHSLERRRCHARAAHTTALQRCMAARARWAVSNNSAARRGCWVSMRAASTSLRSH